MSDPSENSIGFVAMDALRLLHNALGRKRKFKRADFGHQCEAVCAINELAKGITRLEKEIRKCMKRLKHGKMKSFAEPVLGARNGEAVIRDPESGIRPWLGRGPCGAVTIRVFVN